MKVIITSENIDSLLAGDKPLVIDFGAEWCCGCRRIAPDIERLAEQYAGRVVVGTCDVDEYSSVAERYHVRSLPAILFIRDGQVVDTQIGTAPLDKLTAMLEQLL